MFHVNEHYAAVITDLLAQRERIDIALNAIRALQPAAGEGAVGSIRWLDVQEPAPPPPPKRVIPSDPAELKGLAQNLSHQGYGLGEIKTMLELTSAQMQEFFDTDV
jgi:hypothetical protein